MGILGAISAGLSLANKVWDKVKEGTLRRIQKERLRKYRELNREVEAKDDRETEEILRKLVGDE